MIKKDEQMNTSDISFDEMAKLKSDGGDKTDRLILGDGRIVSSVRIRTKPD